MDAIIFVIDSHDESRFKEARIVLESVIVEPQLKDVPLLVLANKSDLKGAKSSRDIEQMLLLPNSGRVYRVLSSSAVQGTGLIEGFIWLHEVFVQKKVSEVTTTTANNKVRRKMKVSKKLETTQKK